MALPVVPIATTDSESQIRTKIAELATEVNALGAGGGGGGATNLSYTPSATNGIVASDTGTDATIPLATTTNAGLLSPAEKARVTLDPTRFVTLFSDCMSITEGGDFAITLISSGSLSTPNALPDRIGLVRFRDSTTAGGGVKIGTDAASIRIQGGGVFETAFQWRDTRTTALAMIGLHSSVTSALPQNGVNFHLVGTATGFTLTGRTSTAGTESISGTSFTGTSDTWYNLRLEINANATSVTYSVLDATRASTLWTDTLTTNIPTGSTNTVGVAVLACETTTDANPANGIMEVDWIRFGINRTLAR